MDITYVKNVIPKQNYLLMKKKDVKKKSDMTSYDKKSMRDCWMAENSAQYNCCMQLGKTYLDEYKKKTNKDKNKSNHFNCCLLNGKWINNSCTDG